nr:MAG TPA: hypothetical protein [Bacteriophage sp.]
MRNRTAVLQTLIKRIIHEFQFLCVFSSQRLASLTSLFHHSI